MQSAYLCVIFHVKQKKLPNSRGFNLISNFLWWNPKWRPFLVTSQASSSVTTRKIDFPLKRKSFRNTVTYQKLRGGVPSTTPSPWNKLFSSENCINLTSTKVCFHKKIWEEQFGFMVDWKNCRHFATPPLGSQRNDVWGTSLEIPWERTWERSWNSILMICVVLLISCAPREIFFNLSEALLRSG